MDRNAPDSVRHRDGLVAIRIPQFGEGLHDVRLVAILRKEGEAFNVDDILYEVETAKSLVAVEAERAGRIVEWSAKVGDVINLKETIGWYECDESSVEEAGAAADDGALRPQRATQAPAAADRIVPPRTRAYAKARSLSGRDLDAVVAAGRVVLPADIDRHIEALAAPVGAGACAFSARQILLNRQFALSRREVVPTTMTTAISLRELQDGLRARTAEAYGEDASVFVTVSELVAFSVARAAAENERFRATIVDAQSYAVSDVVTLGIAVEHDDDELVTAVIEDAGHLDFGVFVNQMRAAVERARAGQDQAWRRPHIVVSSLGGNCVVHGAPALVSPSVATLAIGAIDSVGRTEAVVALTMTFDHRLVSGARAATFLEAVTGTLKATTRRSVVGASEADPPPAGFRPTIKSEFAEALTGYVSHLLSTPLRAEALETPLGLIGVDSKLARRILSFLETCFSTKVPVSFLWRHPTIGAIVEACADEFGLTESGTDEVGGDTELEQLLEDIRKEQG